MGLSRAADNGSAQTCSNIYVYIVLKSPGAPMGLAGPPTMGRCALDTQHVPPCVCYKYDITHMCK